MLARNIVELLLLRVRLALLLLHVRLALHVRLDLIFIMQHMNVMCKHTFGL